MNLTDIRRKNAERRASPSMDPAAERREAVPREFWDLLHEWAESKDEERRDWIEHRFAELFDIARGSAVGGVPLGHAPLTDEQILAIAAQHNWGRGRINVLGFARAVEEAVSGVKGGGNG